jgi:hypothetical protein
MYPSSLGELTGLEHVPTPASKPHQHPRGAPRQPYVDSQEQAEKNLDHSASFPYCVLKWATAVKQTPFAFH